MPGRAGLERLGSPGASPAALRPRRSLRREALFLRSGCSRVRQQTAGLGGFPLVRFLAVKWKTIHCPPCETGRRSQSRRGNRWSRFADTDCEIAWATHPHLGLALMWPLEALRYLSNAAGAFRLLRLISIAIIDLFTAIGYVALLGNRYNKNPQIIECIELKMTKRIAS